MRYLQILTACCDSFAHGANDVANSIGPFAAIIVILKSGTVSKKLTHRWRTGFSVLGAAGIVAGLALYGYKILHALGTKIAKLTPSRGICIELGAACVIIMGSRMGWPLSTTHCLLVPPLVSPCSRVAKVSTGSLWARLFSVGSSRS